MMNLFSAPDNTGARGHMLALPRAFLGLRLLQLILAIIILGMSAYGVHYLDYDGFALSLFTALATMIITVYILVADLVVPMLYNYWALLALDIFGVVFWLASLITMAVNAARFHVYSRSYYGYYSWFKRAIVKRDTTRRTYKNVMIATAVFDAFEFCLFVATLILTVIHLQRHRANGGHSMYNHNGVATTGPIAPAGAPHHVTNDTELASHHQAPTVVEPKDDSLPVQHPPPLSTTAV